ncbi:MAG: hypothetical protein RL264_1908 [Bacteroidota bacterium]|jgi:gliding motility-associated-like protein
MYPNSGQWDSRIAYSIDLSAGKMYVEKGGMTFFLTGALQHAHGEHEKHDHENDGTVTYHAIQQKLIGATSNGFVHQKPSEHYHNYLLGNQPEKWRSFVYGFQEVIEKNVYDGVDLHYDGKNAQIAYSFHIQPHASVNSIRFSLDGADKIAIDNNGNLVLSHRYGTITESAPKAWQTNESGKKIKIACRFQLKNKEVSFNLGANYNPNLPLIIDPSLTFSTFSGSTADNWGFTATPDAQGRLFGGGISFGSGYPTTIGAYDVSFNSGTGSFPIDVAISKYTANGNAQIFSTYIGGSGNETPQSIVAAPNGELFIYGVTSSSNFPMAGSSFDNTFNGGPNVTENSLNFNGADIYVARLNPSGSMLIASTYVGGNSTDGLNIGTLAYNYGDQFRGEIILDNNQNVYVASTSYSNNFPTQNAFQNSISGGQDAVIFKLNAGLSTLAWSTFFGGSGSETGNSITIGLNGNVYVAGGTTSPNLNITGGEDLTFNGGISDGYTIRIAPNGNLLSGTYMGLGNYDQTYFVQTDPDNRVYVYGQTKGAWTMSPGVYGRPNSGQFIRKYSSDLSTINWTTMVGAGTGNAEISPTAFLVSDCYDIYFSGWGGVLNSGHGQATGSTTNGFQVTPDAFQGFTNGSNFYIAVLSQDAAQLKYATFMGGMSSSYNHVDGGTSRFDKSGRIYHAVCGGCGGNSSGFSTTAGSWSPNNLSSNCNMATFKFELSKIKAIVAPPLNACAPATIQFENNSINGNTYSWSFGDGNSSTAISPSHTYTTPGVYQIKLVVTDSQGCFSPDSTTVSVRIGGFTPGTAQTPNPVCAGTPVQLNATGNGTFSWSPAQGLNDPTIPNPIATVNQTTTYTVTITDTCGSNTLSVNVPIVVNTLAIAPDTNICLGQSVQLWATAGGTVSWSPSTYLDNAFISNPTSTPDTTINYTATATTPEGCTATGSVTIRVFTGLPDSGIPDTTYMCSGSQVGIGATGGFAYNWFPVEYMNVSNQPFTVVYPPEDKWYYVDVTNSCGTITDSVFVKVIQVHIVAGNDTVVCSGEKATLWASGAVSYAWSPSNLVVAQRPNEVDVRPFETTVFTVVGTDAVGCHDTAQVTVTVHPYPSLFVTPTVYAFYNDVVQLEAYSHLPGQYTWYPTEFLSCTNCPNPIAVPNQNVTYYVYFTDVNGCKNEAWVNIKYETFVYVPNTFIPNGDNVNDYFRIYGGNIIEMECLIYNRWGELIQTLRSTDDYWDGTYNGKKCQDGTYVWKLTYKTMDNISQRLTGHVNLLR